MAMARREARNHLWLKRWFLACVTWLAASFVHFRTRLGHDAGPSLRHALDAPTTGAGPEPTAALDPLRAEQDAIDHGIDDAIRCARYDVPVLPVAARAGRRLFFGSMLADEGADVLAMHAAEAYGHYHVVALVESNTTHSAAPRALRYLPGSRAAADLTGSGLFGPTSTVALGRWTEGMPGLTGMDREVEQRNTIWRLWRERGMTARDVGIMADLDELVSRDLLNALRACDFEALRHEARPSCQRPKMVVGTIQFDASPLCVKKKHWYHPDIILGACLAGIGDGAGRAVPERTVSLHRAHGGGSAHDTEEGRRNTLGQRRSDWAPADPDKYPAHVLANGSFPLWDGRDVRGVSGARGASLSPRAPPGGEAMYGGAYHLHNWFGDLGVLRRKYATYGHFDARAATWSLARIEGDIGLVVRCVHGFGNAWPGEDGADAPAGRDYHVGNALLPPGEEAAAGTRFKLAGNRPVYFRNRAYVVARHALVRDMVRADEARYGRFYNETHQYVSANTSKAAWVARHREKKQAQYATPLPEGMSAPTRTRLTAAFRRCPGKGRPPFRLARCAQRAAPLCCRSREALDHAYHGVYSLERQEWQDSVIAQSCLLRKQGGSRYAMLQLGGAFLRTAHFDVSDVSRDTDVQWAIFTAGGMGVGKGYAMRWLRDTLILPTECVVNVDPDYFKSCLPEWSGYVQTDPATAGTLCHMESCYLADIVQEATCAR